MAANSRHFRELVESALGGGILQERANELLAPLTTYDEQHSSDLLKTLVTYFQMRENVSRTADALFLHRNGLVYRLNRVEELLGAKLDDREVALALQLALKAYKPD